MHKKKKGGGWFLDQNRQRGLTAQGGSIPEMLIEELLKAELTREKETGAVQETSQWRVCSTIGVWYCTSIYEGGSNRWVHSGVLFE